MPPSLRQLGHLGLGLFFMPDLKLPDDLVKLGVGELVEERMGFLPGGHHHKFYPAYFVGQNFPDRRSWSHFELHFPFRDSWRIVPWGRNYDSKVMPMTNEALIDEAGRRLAAAAPAAEVILFGSRARSEGRPDGDLDLLVIEPDFARRGEEYGRLRKELRGLEVAINLLVYRRREADQWGGVPGSFLHGALEEGRVLGRT